MDGGCLMARVQVSNDPSGHIIVSFPYDPLLVEKVKSIDGHRWHPAEKHWSFPNKNGALEKIFGIHVSTQSIGKIRSPLDSLNLKEGGDN
jgi:hypothetical protein